jgi:uncharacterized protein (DUF433 family)
MDLSIEAQPIPLNAGDDGVIRVAGTRVTLDTVVAAFQQGATPEEIVQQYDSLDLGDVYAVIGYYLRRRSEVETYLREGQNQSEKVRRENESRFNPTGLRDRLLARRSGKS